MTKDGKLLIKVMYYMYNHFNLYECAYICSINDECPCNFQHIFNKWIESGRDTMKFISEVRFMASAIAKRANELYDDDFHNIDRKDYSEVQALEWDKNYNDFPY